MPRSYNPETMIIALEVAAHRFEGAKRSGMAFLTHGSGKAREIFAWNDDGEWKTFGQAFDAWDHGPGAYRRVFWRRDYEAARAWVTRWNTHAQKIETTKTGGS